MKALRSVRHFGREIRDYQRFLDLEAATRRIIFYAEDAASYSYFEGLLGRLLESGDHPICYFTSDLEDPIFEQRGPSLQVFYLKHLLPYMTRNLEAAVLVMTMPDLETFHVKRSRHPVNHIYLFHNIGSSFPVIRYGALFQLYQLPEKTLVEFGYYRLEKTHRDWESYARPAAPTPDHKGSILVAPSWGDASILNVCGRELVRILLDAGYEVTVRPHPMTEKHDPALIRSLKDAFGGNPRFVYAGDISSVNALFDADVLISDWSGVAYEYALGTERPVLFIDVPRKLVNERHEEVGIEPVDIGIRHRIGSVLGPDELDRVEESIQTLRSEEKRYLLEIRKARDELVYNFGHSSEAGARYINDCVNEKLAHVAD
jgi:YidC/Oxa1 family membrane protein insertase